MSNVDATSNSLRQQGDALADDVFLWLKANPDCYADFSRIKTNQELLQFQSDAPLSDLINFTQFSHQSNPDKILAGQYFFQRHADMILPILGFYSLPYCYAGANGVRVLYASKKIKEEPQKRLLETAQFVFDVCQPGAFLPEGSGYVSIVKVRLMHAAARYYSSRQITDEVPVNQEDMLGTLLSFSLLVIRGLKKSGCSIRPNDAENYMYLWNEIGGLMGVRKELIPTSTREASVIERSIRKKEFAPSKEGKELTDILISSMKQQPDFPGMLNPADLMYYFLEEDLSQILGIKPSAFILQGLVSVGLRLQNLFKTYSERNYREILGAFEKAKNANSIQHDFKFTFE